MGKLFETKIAAWLQIWKDKVTKYGPIKEWLQPGLEELSACVQDKTGGYSWTGLFSWLHRPFVTQFVVVFEQYTVRNIVYVMAQHILIYVKPCNWNKSLINQQIFPIYNIYHACTLFSTLWNHSFLFIYR